MRSARKKRPVHEMNPPDTLFELADGWLMA
jgi:hypothetical protein